jgi:uncharacterized membrane protein YphA (DoxX/SURF4 family)
MKWLTVARLAKAGVLIVAGISKAMNKDNEPTSRITSHDADKKPRSIRTRLLARVNPRKISPKP